MNIVDSNSSLVAFVVPVLGILNNNSNPVASKENSLQDAGIQNLISEK